jgi:rhodanese-related sulfurtransferase
VIILAATAIGIAQNAVSSNPIKLIQDGAPVSTAQKHGGDAATADSAGAGSGAAQALPEGSISLSEMKTLFDGGNAFILDARPPDGFAEGHIPGAINIPYDKLPDYVDKLNDEVPQELTVVCYCWGPECDFSDQLATELKFMGYQDVIVFTGGWEEWTAAGYPTEGGND